MKDCILARFVGLFSVLALFSMAFAVYYAVKPTNGHYDRITTTDNSKKKVVTVKQISDKIQIKDKTVKLYNKQIEFI